MQAVSTRWFLGKLQHGNARLSLNGSSDKLNSNFSLLPLLIITFIILCNNSFFFLHLPDKYTYFQVQWHFLGSRYKLTRRSVHIGLEQGILNVFVRSRSETRTLDQDVIRWRCSSDHAAYIPLPARYFVAALRSSWVMKKMDCIYQGCSCKMWCLWWKVDNSWGLLRL